MKNLYFFLFIGLLFSCSNDIQTNTPAFQGEVDNAFFRANVSNAVINQDGSITISGETAAENIEVTASSTDIGTYTFGTGSTNEANFTTFTDAFYTTDNNGNGQIEITNFQDGKITANLNFNARQPGINDILNFNKGIIFEVPINNFNPGDGGSNNADFVATVDGTSFNAISSQASITAGRIFIAAANTQNATISLTFPMDVVAGTYDIMPGGDYSATYGIGGNSENASMGTITITANDTVARVVQGSFSFETTSGINVTGGSFSQEY